MPSKHTASWAPSRIGAQPGAPLPLSSGPPAVLARTPAPSARNLAPTLQVLTMKPGEVQGYEEAIDAGGLMWQVTRQAACAVRVILCLCLSCGVHVM